MKSTRNSNTRQSKQGNSKKPRPEIRDDMDSRKTKDIIPKIPRNEKPETNF